MGDVPHAAHFYAPEDGNVCWGITTTVFVTWMMNEWTNSEKTSTRESWQESWLSKTLKVRQDCSEGRKSARKHRGQKYTLFSTQTREIGLSVLSGAFLRSGVVSQRLPGHEWAFGSASHMSRVGIVSPGVGRETGGTRSSSWGRGRGQFEPPVPRW